MNVQKCKMVIFVNEEKIEGDFGVAGFGLNIDIFLKEQKYYDIQ